MFSLTLARADDAFLRMNSAMADLLAALSDLDDEEFWADDGYRSLTDFVSSRYGTSWGSGQEIVRVARALRSLPFIRLAFREGRLSWEQLRALTRFATAETDSELALRAPGCTVAQLYREAERHRHVERSEAVDSQTYRSAWMSWDSERRYLDLRATFPREQGLVVERILNAESEGVEVHGEVVDVESARMHDALYGRITGESASTHTLVVHVDADVLMDAADPETGPVLSETEDGARLSSETARRLGCESPVEWVLEENRRAVGVGRRSRVLPARLSRVLRHRDGGVCRFSGCNSRKWLHAHHIRHWVRGGSTDLDNLVLLCSFHHRLLHEGGWTVRGHPSETLRFHDPTGREVKPFLGQALTSASA